MEFQTSDVSICNSYKKYPFGTLIFFFTDFCVQARSCFHCCYLQNKLKILFAIPYLLFYNKLAKEPLRVLLKISLCTEIGTSYIFFVTIFAENHLMRSFNPVLFCNFSEKLDFFIETKSKL